MKTSRGPQIQVLDEVEFSLRETTCRGKVIAENHGHYFIEVRNDTSLRSQKDGSKVMVFKPTTHMIPKAQCQLVKKSSVYEPRKPNL